MLDLKIIASYIATYKEAKDVELTEDEARAHIDALMRSYEIVYAPLPSERSSCEYIA